MSKLPPTDWDQIRNVFAAAIDFCEQLETLGYSEDIRTQSAVIRGKNVSAFEVVTSAWSIAEATRYAVIRSRHDTDNDLPYVPETARIIAAAAGVCAELVHSGGNVSAAAGVDRLTTWLTRDGIDAVQATLNQP
ncbi:MAG TPA: hypothetical protein VHC91_20425 [Trinickia sp.]|uniref:hypothetical protein n=1 Tax=Trinickia sp. TaxID=2571163 RepID=UPI002C3D1743|nr:hypothetical protein [Trinickia sp.]HVW52727.1 hypothetical protein [Trinickia sp.]